MGLDMYLTKRHYVKNWEHSIKKIAIAVRENADMIEQLYPENKVTLEGGTPIQGLDISKISYLIEEAAYWRKANMVHDWFVNNVQGGEDNCQEYYVDDEKLEELVILCKNILEVAKTDVAMPEKADDWSEWAAIKILNEEDLKELLPTSGGFFFGSEGYDGTYLYQLKLTVEQLEPLVEKDDNGRYVNQAELYYRASW